jgi:hypothetical protein
MSHPLESSYTKLVRARDHVDAFQQRFESTVERHGFQPIHEMDLHSGRYRIRLSLPDPGIYIAAILGDFANNARAALDHLMWEVVLANRGGRRPPKPNQIFFPIVDRSEGFDEPRVKRLLGYLSHEQRALVRLAQPFMAPDPSRTHVFSFLRDLSNADKHQTAPVLLHGVLPDEQPVMGDPVFHNCGEVIDPHYLIAHGGLYDGVQLVEFRFTELRPDSRVDVGFDITIQPAVREGEHMTALFPTIDNIVIRAFRLIRQFGGYFAPLPNRGELIERLFPTAVARWQRAAATPAPFETSLRPEDDPEPR